MRESGRRSSMAIDPVCGMDVDEKSATGKSERNGRTYFFCAPGCKQQFDNDPEKYIGGETPGENLPRQ
jgi:YHS domain-containing protein